MGAHAVARHMESPERRQRRLAEMTAIELEPADFIDPQWRLVIAISEEGEPVFGDDGSRLRAWYEAQYPQAILSERDARFEALARNGRFRA